MRVNTLIFALELVGMPAFAISGAALGMRKGMDLFGVVVLGLITSVGGGVIRDLTLGVTPPRTFSNPIYAAIAIAVSLLTFLIGRRHSPDLKRHRVWASALLITDSVGLGAFTVAGMNMAIELGHENAFLLVFVGVVTGVGGGVLRDVLAGERPYIFVKHVYATASLLGALVFLAVRAAAGFTWASLAGTAATVLLRSLSAHYRWNFPRARQEPEEDSPGPSGH